MCALAAAAALVLVTGGCNSDGETDDDGREFCAELRSGRSLVDIALNDPKERAPGVYEALTADRLAKFCPEQATQNEEVREVLQGWGFGPDEIAGS